MWYAASLQNCAFGATLSETLRDRVFFGMRDEGVQGQSMTDHPVKGTTPSQICMNLSTHVHHDWESNQTHYHLISII